jgi:predicted esterase
MKARLFRLRLTIGLLGIAACAVAALPASGEAVTLTNNMRVEGKLGNIAKIVQNPLEAATGAEDDGRRPIVLIDDDLRRVFFYRGQIRVMADAGSAASHERITIEQRVASGKRRIGSVGAILGVEPFDEHGRRTFTLNEASLGRVDVVQGITEITPRFTKVEGLQGRNSFVWDMRIATSSIPRETLSAVIKNNIDPKNPDARLSIVRLYLQAERYRDAQQELMEVLKEFPELAKLREEIRSLQALNADRVIKEIKLRRAAGQHALAFSMASEFPKVSDTGTKLEEVSEIVKEYEALFATRAKVLELMKMHLADLKDASLREQLVPLQEEIAAELSVTTLDRMADYLRLADDPKMTPDQKLSLCASGWMLGGGVGTNNLAVSLSLIRVRDLVRQYLSAERPHEREEALHLIKDEEGSTPAYLARIIAAMKPPVKTDAAELGTPGLFLLTTPGLTGEPDISYYVQLPPQYDPYRRYPCVVTLNGAGTSPEQQVDWWAGSHVESMAMRSGQAARHGYVVIAPVWARDGQARYEYSAREHAAVLYSLRDAMRRVSIDSDRVYLSGHSMGGDAAWDIGLAHPDLWAGVLPVVAVADKYVNLYHENARYVPFYFVCGEMDGDKWDRNALSFDRYLTPGRDVMVVQYQGRGHEHFQDEIHQMLAWMNLHKRTRPSAFTCFSMRAWDNFFWWVEVEGFPEATIVPPAAWDTRKGSSRAEIDGKLRADNGVTLTVPRGSKATVWLSPEFVNFDEPVFIGSKQRRVTPTPEVLLEDVRTRCDRQHPFWAKEQL